MTALVPIVGYRPQNNPFNLLQILDSKPLHAHCYDHPNLFTLTISSPQLLYWWHLPSFELRGSTPVTLPGNHNSREGVVRCAANDTVMYVVCVSGGETGSKVYGWEYGGSGVFALVCSLPYRVTSILASSTTLALYCSDRSELILMKCPSANSSYSVQPLNLTTWASTGHFIFRAAHRALTQMDVSGVEPIEQTVKWDCSIIYLNVLRFEGGSFVVMIDVEGRISKWNVKLKPLGTNRLPMGSSFYSSTSSKTDLVVSHGLSFTVFSLGLVKKAELKEKERIRDLAFYKETLLVLTSSTVRLWKGCTMLVGAITVSRVDLMISVPSVGLVLVGKPHDASVVLWRDYDSQLRKLVEKIRQD